jgi:tetratricopeptide (TPR) repeat protein
MPTLLTRGLEYRSKGDYDSAIQDFTEAVRLNQNLLTHRGTWKKHSGQRPQQSRSNLHCLSAIVKEIEPNEFGSPDRC